MMLRKHKTGADKTVPAPIVTAVGPHLLDSTTGLPSDNHLMELLAREVGRCQRYGDRTALAVFDVKVAAFRPTETHPLPPSPATFIASSIVSNFRAADLACRLDACGGWYPALRSRLGGLRCLTRSVRYPRALPRRRHGRPRTDARRIRCRAGTLPGLPQLSWVDGRQYLSSISYFQTRGAGSKGARATLNR